MHIDELRSKLGTPKKKCPKCKVLTPINQLNTHHDWLGSKAIKTTDDDELVEFKGEMVKDSTVEFIRVDKAGSVCPACVNDERNYIRTH